MRRAVAHYMILSVASLVVLGAGMGFAEGATFYVDPVEGRADGDGSEADPWRTIEEVVESGRVETRAWAELPYDEGAELEVVNPGAPVRAGDTIRLRTGYHGVLYIESAYNARPITIEADPGHRPRLARVHLRSVSNWVIRGLSISPEHRPGGEVEGGDLVYVESHGWRGPSHDVVIEGNEMYSADEVSGWSRADWNDRTLNGIRIGGERVTLRDNLVRNVDFGISVGAADAVVMGNVVDGFAGDGLRGLGDRGLFEGNVVMNCYDVNENHDDGFQSWSVGEGGVGTGEVRDVVLRGNTIINYTDPEQPFRCTLQGIGCFDGMFVGWVVENNVIQTDHWHGITLAGAVDSRIANNTVIDLNEERPGPPWIRVSDHKDGRASRDTVVANNLVTSLSIDRLGEGESATPDGVRVASNIVFDSEMASRLFVDVEGGDLHLADRSEAIDRGLGEVAPAFDRDGTPRPQGDGVDIGAYEWFDGTPAFPDRAPDAGGGDSDAGFGGGSDVGPDFGLGGDVSDETDAAGNAAAGSDAAGCACHQTLAGPTVWTAAWAAGLLWLVVLARRSRPRLAEVRGPSRRSNPAVVVAYRLR